jgi:hypothetical protein
VTAAALLGAGAGLGLWALMVWVIPPRPALHTVLARLRDQPAQTHVGQLLPVSGTSDADPSPWLRLVRHLLPTLRAAGLPTPALRRDLAVIGTDPDTYLARKALYGLAGLLAPPVAALGRTLLGAAPAPQTPLLGAVALAAAGFLYPDIQVRASAARRRRDFVHALSAYLDLVVISLAGGAGIDSALHDAATVGNGWAFDQLRHALDVARLTRATAWTTLRQLGVDLGVRELSELAAAATLAGTEGAKIRGSLTARARSLRTHLLTDAEKHAKAATQRMVLPWALLFLGFLAFIGFPALHQITTTLH